jgi:hypothetical protein
MLGVVKTWLKKIRYLECLPYLGSIQKSNRIKMVLVSGADSSHFKSLQQLLRSVNKHEPSGVTVVYDLGLTQMELKSLVSEFPEATVQRFKFEDYPDFFDLRHDCGHYGWKPVIVWEVLQQYPGLVCWMDAGNVLTGRLSILRGIVAKRGLYSPASPRTIVDWSHPATLSWLEADPCILKKRNLSGGCIAVDGQNPRAREVIQRWGECALIKECIAPEGSNRDNHRQDQSIFSILAHQSGLTRGMPRQRYGFLVHQDID